MKYLEGTSYKVLMIHVTASVETINKRLHGRHKEMGEEGFLRAINPNLTQKFVRENKEGFEATQKKYHNIEYIEFDNNTTHKRSASRSASRSPTKSATRRSANKP
jgi:tRNA A37 N6-isopentenylltransferase MiaA